MAISRQDKTELDGCATVVDSMDGKLGALGMTVDSVAPGEIATAMTG